MIFVWIIVSIILFSVIVLIHEWWHFASARKFGVRVEEFWLGIPPRARKLFVDKKWTLFSLNWLPIWGFVKLTWEMPNTFLVFDKQWTLYNNEDLEKDIKAGEEIYYKSWKKVTKSDRDEVLKKLKENRASYNLMNKRSRQQAIIILAWVFMNFVLAIFIFSILFFIGLKPLGINTKIDTDLQVKLIPTYEQAIETWILIKKPGLILSPIEWSIAQKAGIQENEILLSVNGVQVTTPQEMIDIVSKIPWENVTFTTDTQTLEISIWEDGKIWSYVWENIELNRDFEYKYWLIESIKYWTLETYNQALLTFKGLWILIKKIFRPETPQERQEAIAQVSGPIGIVDFISNSMEAWVIFIIVIGAIISINLWVFNLLPIPALDGWRFLFITVNGLIKRIFWRKAISEKTEWFIHVWFFMFLIALSLIIAYNDIYRILLR